MTTAEQPHAPTTAPAAPPYPSGPVPRARIVDGVEERLDAVVNDVVGFRPVTLDVFRAADRQGETLPVIMWIHGGGWVVGSAKQDWPFLEDAGMRARVMDAGFALAMVEYRRAGEAPFPAQIEDVKAAVAWVHRHAEELGIDRDAIVVWGESAGGHLAALAALTSVPESGWSDDVRAPVAGAVVWFAPSELRVPDEAPALHEDDEDSVVDLLLGGPVRERREEAAAASPVTWVSAAAPPMLLVHGTADLLVPAEQSELLADALEAAGGDVRLTLVPGADHGFDGVDVRPIIDAGLEFAAEVTAR
ncbi:alpha/beta hydrolase [Demequina mangrovi]|uniref:Acetyl esterase/lipase n=1 Tax=Demequina mangrovi TaxID=1043493 RepID=A0A1H6WSK6_9MICO|nr:alpha/beta hydrolase [Demequina mangrovi]SEJ19959.1 Acetyl esterase/lipase [Demequina mangrovi]